MSSARRTVVQPYLRAMPQPWHTVTCLCMSSSGRFALGGGTSPFFKKRTATGNVVGRMNSSSFAATVETSTGISVLRGWRDIAVTAEFDGPLNHFDDTLFSHRRRRQRLRISLRFD